MKTKRTSYSIIATRTKDGNPYKYTCDTFPKYKEAFKVLNIYRLDFKDIKFELVKYIITTETITLKK